MKRTIITGLIALSLIVVAGSALAGPSIIQLKTYTQRGEYEGFWSVTPNYLQSPHLFDYYAELDTGRFAENIWTDTLIVVQSTPLVEGENLPTTFVQSIAMDEAGRGDGAEFENALSIMSVDPDGGADDLTYFLDVDSRDTGDPIRVDPPHHARSKDLVVNTGWTSNGSYLIMSQDIFVENIGHVFTGGNRDNAFWPDAVGDIYMTATYGGDYSIEIDDLWGKGIEFEFDWLVGSYAMPP